MRLLLIIIFSVFIGACDDRKEDMNSLNEKPGILLQGEKATEVTKTLYDSVKTTVAEFAYTPFFVVTEDANDNIRCVRYAVEKGNGNLYYQMEVIKDTLPFMQKILLRFAPSFTGINRIRFVVEDRFDRKDSATLVITSFSNIPPIAVIDTAFIGEHSPYEYSLDAERSFDRDKNFGGVIQYYHFTVAGEKIKTLQPKIKYIFPGPGTYVIKLQVEDNDKTMSPEALITVVLK